MEGSRTMPRDHRFGLDENERFGPVRPDPRKNDPEQAIKSIQLGARLFALVKGKSLSKGDRLQSSCVGAYKHAGFAVKGSC
jgi:hypothetical protein